MWDVVDTWQITEAGALLAWCLPACCVSVQDGAGQQGMMCGVWMCGMPMASSQIIVYIHVSVHGYVII